ADLPRTRVPRLPAAHEEAARARRRGDRAQSPRPRRESARDRTDRGRGVRIDNSQVVREVDPRASRDLWWLLILVMTLVGGLVLYAWPHLQIRETARAQDRMSRQRERLLEENRKLRLEKASLENLRRVETIRTHGLRTQHAARATDAA